MYMRSLIVIHRYLGIGMGLLLVMWCLSGIVMIYQPYPQLDRGDRIAGLAAIEWRAIDEGTARLPEPDRPVDRFQVEMLGARPVLRLWFPGSVTMLVDLTSGQPMESVGAEQAIEAAKAYAAAHGSPSGLLRAQEIDFDQWTVGGSQADRPLYRVATGDAQGTELYVSHRSGTVVQITTARQRFWGWLGAVPHWLYFSVLRSRPEIWAQVVIWTSLAGSFLAALGLIIGIKQLRQAGRSRLSPYHGLTWWHHVSGVFFGLFALTWVASGLLSMNPWGLMEGRDLAATLHGINGTPSTLKDVEELVAQLQARNFADLKSVESAPLGGRLFAVGTLADGNKIRYGADGDPQKLGDRDIAEAAVRIAGPGATWQLLTREDAYYYSIMSTHALLPVIRVRQANGDFYYLDPVSAALVSRADPDERDYRWWHSGLHRLDFWPALRSPTARNLIMLPLLVGATVVCVIGAYLGLRRINPMKSN
jgi:uncharacterized iron-regulated membrane protein